ncbi:unnamed protein product [Amoebophrya sp. A25]|nr:unnamed protein product [Amoebophrya sp. A25]|eukprot:GSA25T00006037001.1
MTILSKEGPMEVEPMDNMQQDDRRQSGRASRSLADAIAEMRASMPLSPVVLPDGRFFQGPPRPTGVRELLHQDSEAADAFLNHLSSRNANRDHVASRLLSRFLRLPALLIGVPLCYALTYSVLSGDGPMWKFTLEQLKNSMAADRNSK